MKNIEKIIVKSIKSVEGRQKYAVNYLDWHWSEVLGENIAKHSKPAKIVNGILFINTDNPAWSHSLLMMKNKILAKIVTLIKESSHKVIIKDIRFFNGSVKRVELEKYVDPYILPDVMLLEEDEKSVKKEVSILKDENLRKGFEKLMLSDKRRKLAMQTKYQNNCKVCGVPIRKDEKYCLHCEKERLTQIKDKIADLLRSIPWLDYQDCLNYVNCDRIIFDEVKGNMINSFAEEISDYRCSEDKKAFATMIINNLKPDEVNDEIIHKTAEKIRRRKADVRASWSGLYSKK